MTTILIKEDKVTITSDLRQFSHKAWTGNMEEAIRVWVGKKFTKMDSRRMTRNDFLRAPKCFSDNTHRTCID
jgi:hypothetical protein